MQEFLELVKVLGLPAVLAGIGLVGWLLYTRRLVTRTELEAEQARTLQLIKEEQTRTRQMEEDRDEWKDLCLQLLQTAERTTIASEKIMTAVAHAAVDKKGNGGK